MLNKDVALLCKHYASHPMDFLHREFVRDGERLLELNDIQQMEFYHRATRPPPTPPPVTTTPTTPGTAATAPHTPTTPPPPHVVFEGIKSCTGPGKTTVEALVGLWFECTQFDEVKGSYPQGMAVSDSMARLTRCFIKELRHWHGISPLCKELFEVKDKFMQSRDRNLKGLWRIDFAVQPKLADETAIKTLFSGFHTKRAFITLDESGELNPGLHDGITQVLTAKNLEYLICLQAGNPRKVSSMLYHCEKREELWNVVSITGDPDDPRCSTRINKEFNRELIRKKGRDSDHVRTTVLAEYPNLGPDALFNTALVEAAIGREINSDLDSAVIMGIDVGGGGLDPTMAAIRKGRECVLIEEIDGNLHEQARKIIKLHHEYFADTVNIDATGGYGSDLRLLLVDLGLICNPVKFNERGYDPDQFVNVRAEMVWNTARWFDNEVSIPQDPELSEELLVHTKVESESHSRMQIIDKKIIKKLIKRSPNKADALFLTHLSKNFKLKHNHAKSPEDAEINRVFGEKAKPKTLVYGKNIGDILN